MKEIQHVGTSTFLPSLTPRPPTKQAAKMSSLTFKCEEKGDKLAVTVVSCKGLPDLDGAFNLTDAFVTVKFGKEKGKSTKTVGGSLNPTFDPKTSVFEFDVRSHYIRDLNQANLTLQNGKEVALHSRIRFEVWDKDTISPDDLIGKVGSLVVPFFLSKYSPFRQASNCRGWRWERSRRSNL